MQFAWPDYLDLGPLVKRFTVIIASPRGFPGHDHERMLAHINDAVPDSVVTG